MLAHHIMILTLGTTPTIQRSMTFARIELDEVNRATTVREYASGKSINAARVLKSIGMDVAAIAIVGGDRGEQMRRDLAGSQISYQFIDSAAQTRLCTTMIDQSNHTATELVEESGAIEAAAVDDLFKTLRARIGKAKLLMLCGGLAAGVGEDFYARCLRIANEANVPTLLDTRGRSLQLALSEHPTIVKPNRSELSQTVGYAVDSPDALRHAMRQVVSIGAAWIAVTGGASPTIVSDGKSFWQISVPKVTVVSPIGSGDAFAAGLAAGVTLGRSVPEACKLATACAAANAMTSDAGHVDRSNVDTLLQQVQVSDW